MSFNPEEMLKGRMAESLVEELFSKSGNKIYRFGYEAILQNLTQIEKSFNTNNEAGKMIQTIPDFIIVDKNRNPTFLEVKFRRNGHLHNDDKERLLRIGDFWKAKIIIVNCHDRPFFNISTPKYFENGEFKSKPLMAENSWEIDADAYKKAEELVEKYLTKPLMDNSQ